MHATSLFVLGPNLIYLWLWGRTSTSVNLIAVVCREVLWWAQSEYTISKRNWQLCHSYFETKKEKPILIGGQEHYNATRMPTRRLLMICTGITPDLCGEVKQVTALWEAWMISALTYQFFGGSQSDCRSGCIIILIMQWLVHTRQHVFIIILCFSQLLGKCFKQFVSRNM